MNFGQGQEAIDRAARVLAAKRIAATRQGAGLEAEVTSLEEAKARKASALKALLDEVAGLEKAVAVAEAVKRRATEYEDVERQRLQEVAQRAAAVRAEVADVDAQLSAAEGRKAELVARLREMNGLAADARKLAGAPA